MFVKLKNQSGQLRSRERLFLLFAQALCSGPLSYSCSSFCAQGINYPRLPLWQVNQITFPGNYKTTKKELGKSKKAGNFWFLLALWSNNSSSLAVSESLTFFHADELIEGRGMVCSGQILRYVGNTGTKPPLKNVVKSVVECTEKTGVLGGNWGNT